MLNKLLSSGYFPKELPPIFSSVDFGDAVSKSTDIDRLVGKRWQRPTPYFLQLKPRERRKLDILCPQSFLRIANTIDTNFNDISNYFSNLEGHCSKPIFDGLGKFKRAIRAKTYGRRYNEKKLNLRSRFPSILKIDIKNYYRSIYTHSIPWAIHGKSFAKANQKDMTLLGNQIDHSVYYGQDGQTMGIPIGPDTSFIISEILLCQLFNQMFEKRKLKSDRFIRYYDDIEYGCESITETHSVLAKFHDALAEFELEINSDKIEIFSGPHAIESPWLYHLRDINIMYGEFNASRLLETFSFLADLAKKYPDDHIFRYFLRKMRSVVVEENAWEVYQAILLSLYQEERGNAKEIYDQFKYYDEIGWEINKNAIKEALDRKVSNQLRTIITSELNWAIYGYLLFDIKIDKELAIKVLELGDVPSKVLIVKLAFDQDIAIKSNINSLVRNFDSNVLNSQEWILAYEILVNKWHNKYNAVQISENPELFEFLRDEKISFLDSTKMEVTDLPTIFRDPNHGTVDHFEEDEDLKDDIDLYGEDDEDDEDDNEDNANFEWVTSIP